MQIVTVAQLTGINHRLARLAKMKEMVEERTDKGNKIAARANAVGIFDFTRRQVRKAVQGKGGLLRRIYEAEAARAGVVS